MKADDILRMAREAGLLVPTYRDHITHLERFAAMVAAAERAKLRSNQPEGDKDEEKKNEKY